jgi:hypothetical protein
MPYNILGVHVQIEYAERPSSRPIEPPKRYHVYAAWASNLPQYGFLWRCTEAALSEFPTPELIQREVAARGSDVRDQKLVKKLFPYLPGNALTD